MSRIRLEIIFLIITSIAAWYFFSRTAPTTLEVEKVNQEITTTTATSTPTLTIGNNAVHVGVAETDATRIQGLSGQEKLDSDTGLFFIFDKPFRAGIWMKDMNFPIDILWFDTTFKLITVKENATPASFPTIFYPSSDAVYVLEVPEGFVKSHNISIGQKATFSRN